MTNVEDPQRSDPMPIRELFNAAFDALQEHNLQGTLSDAELSAIQELVALRTPGVITRIVNSRRPVNRLPTEILCLIFRESIREMGSTLSHMDVRDAFTLSYVCYHWREVMLGSPGFWTSIASYHSAEETKELLARARGLPLQVAVSSEYSTWFWDVCPERVSSIRELDWEFISFRRSHGTPVPDQLTDTNAMPVANAVVRLSFADEPNSRSNHFILPNILPDTVKFLSFKYFTWLWSPFTYPALTHLAISREFALNPLFNVLSGSPGLETLVLQSVMLDDETLPQVSDTPIELPRLRRISLDLNPWLSSSLLALLKFDRLNAAIEISFESEGSDHINYCPPFFSPGSYAARPLMRLDFQQVLGSWSCGSFTAMNDACGIRFSTLVWDHSPGHANLIEQNVDLALVTELSIEAVNGSVYQLFYGLRSRMPRLQVLNLVASKRYQSDWWTHARRWRDTWLMAPVVRLVFADAMQLEELKPRVASDLLRLLPFDLLVCEQPPIQEKNRLIVCAPSFPPWFFTEALPRLEESWEHVEIEVIQVGSKRVSGMEMPMVSRADPEFPAWGGW